MKTRILQPLSTATMALGVILFLGCAGLAGPSDFQLAQSTVAPSPGTTVPSQHYRPEKQSMIRAPRVVDMPPAQALPFIQAAGFKPKVWRTDTVNQVKAKPQQKTAQPRVIEPSALAITSPNVSTVIMAGEDCPVKWTSTGLIGRIEIILEYTPITGNAHPYRLATNIQNSGSYTVRIPQTVSSGGGGEYRIKIVSGSTIGKSERLNIYQRINLWLIPNTKLERGSRECVNWTDRVGNVKHEKCFHHWKLTAEWVNKGIEPLNGKDLFAEITIVNQDNEQVVSRGRIGFSDQGQAIPAKAARTVVYYFVPHVTNRDSFCNMYGILYSKRILNRCVETKLKQKSRLAEDLGRRFRVDIELIHAREPEVERGDNKRTLFINF